VHAFDALKRQPHVHHHVLDKEQLRLGTRTVRSRLHEQLGMSEQRLQLAAQRSTRAMPTRMNSTVEKSPSNDAWKSASQAFRDRS
jgi:hypothetical protein